MLKQPSSAELLAEHGVFSRHWRDFSARPGQQQMATLVEEAIAEQRSLVVEAASGSGKTLAYLVPIISRRRRAIISTGSRYLQQQLFNHDIPLAIELVATDTTVALLQGRRHYLCPYYLEKNQQDRPELGKPVLAQLALIQQRFRDTGQGELARLAPGLPASVQTLVTSGADNCLASRCPKVAQCPLMQARQRAQNATIVVVNHSLLFSDQLLKQQHLDGLLPNTDVVVVDEAHRLADFAQTLIGSRLSSRQLRRFIADCKPVIKRCCPEQKALAAALQQLEQGLNALAQRLPVMADYRPAQYVAIVKQLIASLQQLAKHLHQLQQRHHHLAELLVRNEVLIATLVQLVDDKDLCWIQSTHSGFIIHAIPGHLSAIIKPLMASRPGSWLFTSATLSVSTDPRRFLATLGLEEVAFHRVSSSIDYQRHARLFTPRLSVPPGQAGYSQCLIAEIVPLLQLLAGRVLCLFSSHRALAAAAHLLQPLTDRPLLVQSASSSRAESHHYPLIQAFKQADRGVLLATGSFWEGVDLAGLPLSAVIIDKLPFALPSDPLVQFRSRELARHGVDSFEQYLLPEAVIRMRQGCGRLLRRINDRGVIMLADPRLHSRSYGQLFIDSLPAMQQVYSITALRAFFDSRDTKLSEESETQ